MKITAKYTGKNFFGFSEYMECSERFTEITCKKALAGLKKDKELAIHVTADSGENTAFYYDSYTDFENGVITVHHARSYHDIDAPVKMSFTKAKKMIMDLLKQAA